MCRLRLTQSSSKDKEHTGKQYPKATAGSFISLFSAHKRADILSLVYTGSAAIASTSLVIAHAELAANGAIHCLPGELERMK